MRKFISIKLMLPLVVFITLVSTSITLYANLEIVYDLFNINIEGCFCENCGAHKWNLDIPDDSPYHPGNAILVNLNEPIDPTYEYVPVYNMQCCLCFSEFHFDTPVTVPLRMH